MSTRLRMNTAQVAEYGDRHPSTVHKAAQSGELHGGQRKAGGRWSFRVECVDAWLDGEQCQHQTAEAEQVAQELQNTG